MNITRLNQDNINEYKAFCQQTQECVIASSLEEAKQLVDELTNQAP